MMNDPTFGVLINCPAADGQINYGGGGSSNGETAAEAALAAWPWQPNSPVPPLNDSKMNTGLLSLGPAIRQADRPNFRGR